MIFRNGFSLSILRYHEIVTGNNELTSKITCLDGGKPLTKWNSINVTGYKNSLFSPNIDKNKTSVESSFKQSFIENYTTWI